MILEGLSERLTRYLEVDDFAAAGDMLRHDPDLYGPAADRWLTARVSAAGADPATAVRLLAHRGFLRRCRTKRLAAIFPTGTDDIDPTMLQRLRPAYDRAEAAEARYDAGRGTSQLIESARSWAELHARSDLSAAYPDLQAALANDAGRVLLRLSMASASAARTALPEAVQLFRRAVVLTPQSSGRLAGRLNNLGFAYCEQFRSDGDRATLDTAVSLLRVAVAVARDYPRRGQARNSLCSALIECYRADGNGDHLAEALAACRGQRAAGGGTTPELLHQEGNLVRMLVEAGTDPGQLDLAVELLSAAADAEPTGSPLLVRRRVDLAIALLDRHRHTVADDDLDRARHLLELARDQCDADSPDRAGVLAHGALAGIRQYEVSGSIEELEHAIELLEDALSDERLVHTVDRVAWSVDLAAALRERAIIRDRPADHLRAVDLLIRHRDEIPASQLGPYLNNLGNTLADYGSRNRSRPAVDTAVTTLERSAELSSGETRQLVRTNLAEALLLRADLGGPADDVRRALSIMRSVRAAAGSRGELARCEIAFGAASAAAFEAAPDPGLRAAAERAYEAGCRAGLDDDPDTALRGARSWATWSNRHRWWHQSQIAYDLALRAAWRAVAAQLSREHKENWLDDVGRLGAGGGWAAAEAGDRRAAVAMVESSRAVLLSEAIGPDRLRLEQLGRDAPPLAARLLTLSRRVEVLTAALVDPFHSDHN